MTTRGQRPDSQRYMTNVTQNQNAHTYYTTSIAQKGKEISYFLSFGDLGEMGEW